jgi:predicted acyl esterase
MMVMQHSVEETRAGLYVMSHHIGTTTVLAQQKHEAHKLITPAVGSCSHYYVLVFNTGPMVL